MITARIEQDEKTPGLWLIIEHSECPDDNTAHQITFTDDIPIFDNEVTAIKQACEVFLDNKKLPEIPTEDEFEHV